MKKYLLPLLSLILLFSSCSNNISNAQQKKPVVNEIKKNAEIKAVTYDYDQCIFPANIKDNGFNTVILSCNATRLPNEDYRINSQVFDTLMTKINYLSSNNMNYILSFCEGPGFSYTKNINSIFDNKEESAYFAQMIIEVLDKCYDKPNFKGISIDISSNGIEDSKYYGTINGILYIVYKKYPNINIIYNLTSDSFNSSYTDEVLKYIPEFRNITINAKLCLYQVSYPGNCKISNEFIKLNRTILLDKLENLKVYQDKRKILVIITLKIPWVEKSDILLQDIFEIAKTLDFDYNIYSSNSNGNFDFSCNSNILRIIKKGLSH